MHYIIYKTTNLINHKVYIGQHRTEILEDGYLGSGVELVRDFREYGKENFKREILFIFDTHEEMDAKEIELVTQEFCLREDTYNLISGGIGTRGVTRSLETRKKIGDSQRGIPRSEETKRKISESLKGQKLSAERIAKMSASLKGKAPTNKGKKLSEETRRKMSEAARNRTKPFTEA